MKERKTTSRTGKKGKPEVERLNSRKCQVESLLKESLYETLEGQSSPRKADRRVSGTEWSVELYREVCLYQSKGQTEGRFDTRGVSVTVRDEPEVRTMDRMSNRVSLKIYKWTRLMDSSDFLVCTSSRYGGDPKSLGCNKRIGEKKKKGTLSQRVRQ